MDIKQKCKCCNAEFIITEDEQYWYKGRDFKLPKNCPKCRAKRREERKNGEKKN